MQRCQRLPWIAILLATGWLLSACDPKPTAGAGKSPASASANSTPASSGAYPAGIRPADSGDKVDQSSAHKGPSEGGTAVGGVTGPNGGGASGGTPAPSGGDGAAPGTPGTPSK
ncbi:MAG: hypothetical protein V4636_04750 [Pseudomonadota bacterium]